MSILEADVAYPDSVFIEDTALLTSRCAVITRPGAESRRGEIAAVEAAVSAYYERLERIAPPDCLDAGDVMMVGDHYYIGLSKRTTERGAGQLIGILQKYGLKGSTVTLDSVLHLKTGVVYLANGYMVAAGEFISKAEFSSFRVIAVDDDEQYAANCVWINGKVLVASGYPKLKTKLQAAGYETLALDMSEFRKLDGGLSCLSLRF